eukprot:3329795-Amphidinium_carterae.1
MVTLGCCRELFETHLVMMAVIARKVAYMARCGSCFRISNDITCTDMCAFVWEASVRDCVLNC